MIRLQRLALALLIAFSFASCRDSRVHENKSFGAIFKKYGIDSGCFIMRDHAHESLEMYNKDRCLERFMPASTFKIFNSLVALETGVANDDRLIISWDSVVRWNADWNKDMDMREAFRVSNVAYYQEIARRIGRQNMQHYLDTVKYGNMRIGNKIDEFWLNDTLRISADEQVGFIKKLYFDELPFTARTQSIVKNMMLREDSASNRYYYKTGTGSTIRGNRLLWIVGFLEHSMQVKEDPKSMNKSGVRNYPYFFALNFEVPEKDSFNVWSEKRVRLLHELLDQYGATRNE